MRAWKVTHAREDEIEDIHTQITAVANTINSFAALTLTARVDVEERGEMCMDEKSKTT